MINVNILRHFPFYLLGKTVCTYPTLTHRPARVAAFSDAYISVTYRSRLVSAISKYMVPGAGIEPA